jgi:ferric-dicitrate binding protein FerR (iron transport regulator)
MEDKISRIASLIIKHQTDELDVAEHRELNEWISESSENQKVYEGLINNQVLASKLEQFDDAEKGKEMAWDRLQSKELFNPAARVVRMRRWTRIAAAVAVLLLLSAGFLLWLRPNPKPIAKTEEKNHYKNDIPAPVGSKSRLILADGSSVLLDDAKNGELAKEGNTAIIKENGELNYKNGQRENEKIIKNNTLECGKGGFEKLTLEDGSKVWLNSNSSLTYPVAFIGNERRVSIKGEAYFEVAHNSAKPFMVDVNGKESVKVLGTHFDIMAYEDESEIRTTLLEGSVQVSKDNKIRTIKPGEQVRMSGDGEMRVVDSANVEQVVAWKNGLFDFDGTDIKSIMRELQRWYPIDVKFQPGVSGNFSARKLSKDAPISKVLGYFELTEGVHFKVEGNSVTVTR